MFWNPKFLCLWNFISWIIPHENQVLSDFSTTRLCSIFHWMNLSTSCCFGFLRDEHLCISESPKKLKSKNKKSSLMFSLMKFNYFFSYLSRSQAMGLFYVCSQLGGGLAPWISKGLLRFHFTLPFLVLGAFPVCCFFLALTLKETKGQNIDSQGL